MNQESIVHYIDGMILFCFCVLVIFLPIAYTESIRAFSLGIPGGLWIIKMIITRRWLFSRTPLDLPILLFTIVAGLSVLTAVDFWYSLDEFQGEWLTGIFLFYLAVNNLRSEHLKYALAALLLGNVLMVSYGIYDFVHLGGVLFDRNTRAGSLHSGMGTFGTYLVTLIPYLVVAVIFDQWNRRRMILLALLSLNFFALLLNYSLGAWTAIVVLLLFVGWRFLPKKVMIPSLALLVGGFLVAPQGANFYYHRFIQSDVPLNSYNARWILAKFSLEKIGKNPFQMLGFGQRSFFKKYKSLSLEYKDALLWHAHNTFLNIALQTGLQGLVIFCFLIYKILRYCHEKAQLEKSLMPKFYFLATFFMVIIFFVRNLSDDFFVDDSALLFWFLCGAAVALNFSVRPERVEG